MWEESGAGRVQRGPHPAALTGRWVSLRAPESCYWERGGEDRGLSLVCSWLHTQRRPGGCSSLEGWRGAGRAS